MWQVIFGRWYIAMAVAITGAMAFGLLLLSEFVFIEPYLVGHIPRGTEAGFALILGISALSGLVIPMNVYRIRMMSSSSISGGLAGSIIGTVAGACSCGPLGFAVISTFGSAGAVASSFLTNYEIPIRAAALALLALTAYTSYRAIRVSCSIR